MSTSTNRTLTLREVPDNLVRALRARARRNRRSMQAELLSIVASSVVDKGALARQMRACRAGMKSPMSMDEIHGAIEEGRP
ncbi:MAG: Arc family DNA-binding protein [Myxococcota bacterium]|nr:Arc family DNA-binding protein [Myxococcota bacterium]MDI7267278.1 Arc family DNA-binding protein [Myxococcota bacterium]